MKHINSITALKKVYNLNMIIKQDKSKLALFGGKPVNTKPLPIYNSIGNEEVRVVTKLMRDVTQGKALLSGFLGRAGERFLGGTYIRKLETDFESFFGVRYAVSYNSATTALQGAVAALGIGSGDEVITSPFTMAATATAVLLNGADSVFADLDPKTYCISAETVQKKITKRTRAIIVVNLFGGSADYAPLLKLAKKHGLKIIEDNAQAPAARYHGQYAGTIGDIGVFSFNVHKTIQAGEGGMLVTNNKRLAHRARLVRNHAEAIEDDLRDQGIGNLEYLPGSNYRLTELQAAIVVEQLKKLNQLTKERIQRANYLSQQLKRFAWLQGVTILPKTKHVYYLYPIKFFKKKIGIRRDIFLEAMKKEGFILNGGYNKPLHMMPLFEKRKKERLPIVEQLYKSELIVTTLCQQPNTKHTIDQFIKALSKVESEVEALKQYEKKKKG
jgi:perosamine synthetase